MKSWLVSVIGLLQLIASSPATLGADSEQPPVPDLWGGDAELLLIGPQDLTRITINVKVEGQPVGTAWDQAIKALFQFLDSDDNGELSAHEAARLPTPFSVRRLLWGSISTPLMLGDRWKSVDQDQDGMIGLNEVSRFYQRNGVGVQVSTGRAPATASLTEILVQKIDADVDGKLTVEEVSHANARLAPLDLNEDQLISSGELIRGVNYPGSNAAIRLTPFTAAHQPKSMIDSIWLLPVQGTDIAWARALRSQWTHADKLTLAQTDFGETQFTELDTNGDGSLNAMELARLRLQSPAAAWTAEFSNDAAVLREPRASASNAVNTIAEYSGKDLVLSVRTEAGELNDAWITARQHIINLFNSADLQQQGFLEAKDIETQKDTCLRGALACADRNDNGQLSRKELDAWLATIDTFMRAQIQITIIDFGRGLFEYFDRDHDGLLSVRELRAAAEQSKSHEAIVDGHLVLDRLPRTVHVAISQGRPIATLPHPRRTGPTWFLAMDRNGDGDVSRQEWKSKPNFFDKYDQNHDDLLSPTEANQAIESKQ